MDKAGRAFAAVGNWIKGLVLGFINIFTFERDVWGVRAFGAESPLYEGAKRKLVRNHWLVWAVFILTLTIFTFGLYYVNPTFGWTVGPIIAFMIAMGLARFDASVLTADDHRLWRRVKRRWLTKNGYARSGKYYMVFGVRISIEILIVILTAPALAIMLCGSAIDTEIKSHRQERFSGVLNQALEDVESRYDRLIKVEEAALAGAVGSDVRTSREALNDYRQKRSKDRSLEEAPFKRQRKHLEKESKGSRKFVQGETSGDRGSGEPGYRRRAKAADKRWKEIRGELKELAADRSSALKAFDKITDDEVARLQKDLNTKLKAHTTEKLRLEREKQAKMTGLREEGTSKEGRIAIARRFSINWEVGTGFWERYAALLRLFKKDSNIRKLVIGAHFVLAIFAFLILANKLIGGAALRNYLSIYHQALAGHRGAIAHVQSEGLSYLEVYLSVKARTDPVMWEQAEAVQEAMAKLTELDARMAHEIRRLANERDGDGDYLPQSEVILRSQAWWMDEGYSDWPEELRRFATGYKPWLLTDAQLTALGWGTVI